MTTMRQEELADAAEVASDNGHEETADELLLLAGDSAIDAENAIWNEFLQSEKNSENGKRMSDFEERPTRWLWKNWIPIGTVTILAGAEGTIKSTLIDDLGARVSSDQLMPDGSPCYRKGGVVLVSLEESIEETIVARLRFAEADLTKIWAVQTVKRTVQRLGDPVDQPFCLPDDLGLLIDKIDEVNASLVILDPYMSIVNDRLSTARNQSTRKFLSTLQAIADVKGVAIVIVAHNTKGSTRDMIQRIGGSKAVTDYPRAVLTIAKDVSQPGHIVLSLEKHSLAPDQPQIVFTLNQETMRLEYLTGISQEQKSLSEARKLITNRQKAHTLLESRPGYDFTSGEICQIIGVTDNYACQLLRRMTKVGEIEQTDRGYYHALVKPEIAA